MHSAKPTPVEKCVEKHGAAVDNLGTTRPGPVDAPERRGIRPRGKDGPVDGESQEVHTPDPRGS
ncbi:hypothetical protein KFL01_04150 [Kocuria flava]|uniref:Uncharacterized protein n=1 Tax=Kocuria flava TaxID=446860 RepID=A0ABQ0X5L9_9MICC|nr:hypothetical protein KFL01_04150 [Kocuria flava]